MPKEDIIHLLLCYMAFFLRKFYWHTSRHLEVHCIPSLTTMSLITYATSLVFTAYCHQKLQMIRETSTLLLVLQVQPNSCVNTNLHPCRFSPTTAVRKIFVSWIDFRKRLKCVRQHLVSMHSSSMWKPVTTTFSKLVWHWKVTIWRCLAVLFGLGFQLHSVPYKGRFLFMWQARHFFQACHIQL